MKKILLVADMGGWIFERHCKEIQKRLKGEFHIDIAYSRGWRVNKAAPYDLVYFLDPFGVQYPPKEKCIIGLRCEFLYMNHPGGAEGLYRVGLPGACSSIRDKCSVFHVVNKRQMKVFEKVVTDKPLLCVPHGVDEKCFDKELYTPEPRDKFTVGFTGRVESLGKKGLNVIKKVCDELEIDVLSADYKGTRLTKEQMPSFYRKLNAYVCMSESEGVNNPILESGAMGLPVISTHAGAAPEIIENEVNGLLIERNQKALAEALVKLKSDPEKCKKIGDNLYNTIMKDWSWKVRINGYRDMFNLFFERLGK